MLKPSRAFSEHRQADGAEHQPSKGCGKPASGTKQEPCQYDGKSLHGDRYGLHRYRDL